jgi:hypothetical protein
MKPELNNENKAKFFALYWGQKIGMFKLDNHQTFDIKLGNGLSLEKCYSVRLKPLREISDEDAIEVARISKTRHIISVEVGKAIVWSCVKKYIQYPDLMAYVYDYLRSKGYALPWMGLSVEEMVQAGWIKLI